MVEEGQIVIACGGGGVPVVKNENGDYIGTEAIIDKDFASEKLAEELEADYLIILTAVEKWRSAMVHQEKSGWII